MILWKNQPVTWRTDFRKSQEMWGKDMETRIIKDRTCSPEKKPEEWMECKNHYHNWNNVPKVKEDKIYRTKGTIILKKGRKSKLWVIDS
jgi:hypothetical protein